MILTAAKRACEILAGLMSEESTTPDLVEATGRMFEEGLIARVIAPSSGIDEACAAAERLSEEPV